MIHTNISVTKYRQILKIKWDKVFTSGPSKICGRQPLKNCTSSNLENFVPNKTSVLIKTTSKQCSGTEVFRSVPKTFAGIIRKNS